MTVGPQGRPVRELGSRTFRRIDFHRSSRWFEAVMIVHCVPKHRYGGAPNRGNRLVAMTRGADTGGRKAVVGQLKDILSEPR